MIEFEWDVGNTKHILNDHPERENTIEEVESIFYDPHFIIAFNRVDENGENRYCGVGIGNDKHEKFVVFIVRAGKIRPISCRRANKKDRIRYYENIIKNL